MKLILHIGQIKTGTTTLQHFLCDNERQLNETGICLSRAIGRPNNRGLVACFQEKRDAYFKLRAISDPEKVKVFREKTLTSFKKEVAEKRQKFHTMIISSEHFHCRIETAAALRQLSEFLREIFDHVQVICYVREQSASVNSAYNTLVRAGGTSSFEDFIEGAKKPGSTVFDLLHLSDNWSENFRADRFSLRIYAREQLFRSDIRSDFLFAIGLSNDEQRYSFDTKDKNTSLSAKQISTIRQINKLFPRFRGDRVSILHRCVKDIYYRSGLHSKHPRIEVSHYDKDFGANFRERNEELGRRYFGVDGSPFEARDVNNIQDRN